MVLGGFRKDYYPSQVQDSSLSFDEQKNNVNGCPNHGESIVDPKRLSREFWNFIVTGERSFLAVISNDLDSCVVRFLSNV